MSLFQKSLFILLLVLAGCSTTGLSNDNEIIEIIAKSELQIAREAADEALEADDSERAISIYMEALQSGDLLLDEQGEIHYQLGRIYVESQEFDLGAEQHLIASNLLSRNAKALRALIWLGNVVDDYQIPLQATIRLATNYPASMRTVTFRILIGPISKVAKEGTDQENFEFLSAIDSAGYDGGEMGQTADEVHFALAKLLVKRGRIAEALFQIEKFQRVSFAAQTLASRAFEPLWELPEFVKLTDLKKMEEKEILFGQQSIIENPGYVMPVSSYLATLRSMGRLEDVITLGSAAFMAVDKYEYVMDEHTNWLINELVYAYVAMGQMPLAEALMSYLTNKRLEDDPSLISQIINFAAIELTQNKPQKALQILTKVDGSEFVSPYGQKWILSIQACAHFALDSDEIYYARALKKLEGNPEENYAALNMAYLCANQLDSSARLAIIRLEKDNDRIPFLQALAEFKNDEYSRSVFQKTMQERFNTVKFRPDVQAKIHSVGRIIVLPFYWGAY